MVMGKRGVDDVEPSREVWRELPSVGLEERAVVQSPCPGHPMSGHDHPLRQVHANHLATRDPPGDPAELSAGPAAEIEHTGVRVAELVAIRLDDVNLDACRIRITRGKGGKDRFAPFPTSFKETLALYMQAMRERGATHLFESSWKKAYSTRGVQSEPCHWPFG